MKPIVIVERLVESELDVAYTENGYTELVVMEPMAVATDLCTYSQPVEKLVERNLITEATLVEIVKAWQKKHLS